MDSTFLGAGFFIGFLIGFTGFFDNFFGWQYLFRSWFLNYDLLSLFLFKLFFLLVYLVAQRLDSVCRHGGNCREQLLLLRILWQASLVNFLLSEAFRWFFFWS